eukprot:6362090-Ditylum_brightwellii.AAC.1
MMPQQPQAAFAGFSCSLQFEWPHMQRAMELSGDAFNPVEDVINAKLLPALFGVPQLPVLGYQSRNIFYFYCS